MEKIHNDEITFLSRKILELNKQLIESERAKSRFLSLIANELNNPMTALLGMIPHLEPTVGDLRKEIYALVMEEALLLDSRIQNLVAASEIESGNIDITSALISPKSLVDEAIEAFRYRIQSKNITLNITDKLRDKVVTDPKKLYLIIKNILGNACDYGDDDSIVAVTIEEKESVLTIRINNQGKGPNVEYKPQVFTRFAQGPEGNHGLGLGLSVARELSERLSGGIDYSIDDTSVTFVITLPLQKNLPDSDACGSNEFLFESFDDAIEL
ncbi:MAG: HAMP domain-containing sensor histidine kinase [Sulfuricurvum sp.]|uniref:sensor histidine kinase n=1 Tax=Sulfuricurvum sp. TaxID=2025608 RepID=UPI002614D7CD|nr:HAMP domain-containing sensor histidine kinase [Sulfuricurvum sp.]MDD2829878.1 HAMP domain-containing sensor histidine kinase [Sulfuricurvum sp.]MDD4949209.1 HAMP domain-containing sensor histidine kinase [Sulfuricurvum sp.]